MRGAGVSGGGNRKCKGPEVRTCPFTQQAWGSWDTERNLGLAGRAEDPDRSPGLGEFAHRREA